MNLLIIRPKMLDVFSMSIHNKYADYFCGFVSLGGFDMLYSYLKEKYGENEPIILSDIKIDGMSDNNIRQQMMKLTGEGKLKRYDTGIYFIPKRSTFLSSAQLSCDRVIEVKYLQAGGGRCGYISGLMFANLIGLTTQVSMVYDIVTNKATRDYRETMLAQSRIIVRKPRTPVTEGNYKALQFLDLLKDIDMFAEISGDEIHHRLIRYMNTVDLDFPELETYLPYYPDRVYKNLYRTRLVHGISAQ